MDKPVEFVIENGALLRYIGPGGDVTIPYGVREISNLAFSYNLNVTGVTIPDGVRYIGICAFFNCENMARVSIPDSVEAIMDDAFEGCGGLAIKAPAGGRVARYAKKHRIPFEALGGPAMK